jgi:hypothetical protein
MNSSKRLRITVNSRKSVRLHSQDWHSWLPRVCAELADTEAMTHTQLIHLLCRTLLVPMLTKRHLVTISTKTRPVSYVMYAVKKVILTHFRWGLAFRKSFILDKKTGTYYSMKTVMHHVSVRGIILNMFFRMHYSPRWAFSSSLLRFLNHTQLDTR